MKVQLDGLRHATNNIENVYVQSIYWVLPQLFCKGACLGSQKNNDWPKGAIAVPPSSHTTLEAED